MNTEKYIVRLSDEERQELQSIVKKRKGTLQTVKQTPSFCSRRIMSQSLLTLWFLTVELLNQKRAYL